MHSPFTVSRREEVQTTTMSTVSAESPPSNDTHTPQEEVNGPSTDHGSTGCEDAAVIMDTMDADDDTNDTNDDDDEEYERIIPFMKYETDPFVRSSTRLLQVLRSLHRNQEAVIFPNRAGDLKIMLRSTAESEAELMTFEIVVPHDPEDDKGDYLKRVLTNDYACAEDDEGDFVFETLLVSEDASKHDVDELLDTVNFFYNTEICECHAHLVKTDDGGGMCFQCHLQADDTENTGNMCLICAEDILSARGLMTMTCCRQTMHRKCFNLWKQDKTRKNCPVCRS